MECQTADAAIEILVAMDEASFVPETSREQPMRSLTSALQRNEKFAEDNGSSTRIRIAPKTPQTSLVVGSSQNLNKLSTPVSCSRCFG